MAGLAHLACSARRPRRGAAALIGVAVVLVPMAADPAIAAPGRVTEFLLPTPNSGPSGITSGADRSVWFTEASASRIGRITTR